MNSPDNCTRACLQEGYRYAGLFIGIDLRDIHVRVHAIHYALIEPWTMFTAAYHVPEMVGSSVVVTIIRPFTKVS